MDQSNGGHGGDKGGASIIMLTICQGIRAESGSISAVPNVPPERLSYHILFFIFFVVSFCGKLHSMIRLGPRLISKACL